MSRSISWQRRLDSMGWAALLGLGTREGLACAVCFGAPDSPMTQGLNMGIFSLLVVVLVVLGGAAAFFIFLARRSAEGAKTLASAGRSEEIDKGRIG